MSNFPDNWPDIAWAKLSQADRDRAVAIIRNASWWDTDMVTDVVVGHRRYGHDFIHEEPFAATVDIGDETVKWSWHMSGGMGVRNYLRQEGFTDDQLPTLPELYDGKDVSTWDDFYVQVMEAAAGLRD
ncbi:hypothetical protein [Candidatus Solirubrobacter pratensis]|uniref:hypothetical protein n=1 Tax=Candidatus Solirubrobacter pratensis TaxID=1298857 RepID=UPI0003FC3271|nr:hypothetical protein [Candidatus Solirubrobacter pratensis]